MQAMLLKKFRWSRTESYPLFLARLFALLSLCAVPVSTAGVNLGSGIVLFFALLSPEAWKACRKLRASPASIAALILFIALALSLTYSAAGRDEAVNFLMKYRKLLLLPVLFLVFHGSDRTMWGRASIWALFTTLTFTMVLTYTNFLGWTAVGPLHGNDAITKPWVFKDHISGGLMMAFLVCVAIGYMAIFVFVQLARSMQQNKRTRWITTMAAIVGCIGVVCYAFMAKDSRLAETGQEINQFEVHNKDTSVGVRLEFYRRSSELILMRPVEGFGVGSVRTEFELLAKNSTGGRAAMAGNPHNEFFLMGVQLGLVGIALFVWFLVAVERECRRLERLERTVVYGYLFAFVLGCFANSLLLNFTEGNLFIFLTGILLFSGRRRSDRTPQGAIAN
jgi:O-antigen ligase